MTTGKDEPKYLIKKTKPTKFSRLWSMINNTRKLNMVITNKIIPLPYHPIRLHIRGSNAYFLAYKLFSQDYNEVL